MSILNILTIYHKLLLNQIDELFFNNYGYLILKTHPRVYLLC